MHYYGLKLHMVAQHRQSNLRVPIHMALSECQFSIKFYFVNALLLNLQ